MSTYKKYTKAELAAYRAGKAAQGKTNTKKTYKYAKKGNYQRKYYKEKADARIAASERRKTDGAEGAAIGMALGSALGGVPGGALGSLLGRGAHQMFTSLTGFGDYKVARNSLMIGGMSPPMIQNTTSKGGVIVRHREMLQDILASTAFTVQSFPINPGLPASFPLLSGIACCFEEYRMRGLVYEFKSLSSDAVLSTAANSSLGSVVMATDYNEYNGNFANKPTMENYEFANSSKPSCSFYHPVECKASQTPVTRLWVRTPVSDTTQGDLRLYDLGNFQIATVGQQVAGGVLGELWCTYEVEFYKPRCSVMPPAITDHFDFQGTINGNTPFGTSAPNVKTNTIGGSIQWGSSDPTYYFGGSNIRPGDRYLFVYSNTGNDVMGVTITAPVVAYTGCTQVSKLPVPQDTVAGCLRFSMEIVVEISTANWDIANPPTIEFSTNGTLPNGISCDLVVTRLSPGYVE